MGIAEVIFILTVIGGVWLTAAIIQVVKNGGIATASGATTRCGKCGGSANIIKGWWGSFYRCSNCGDKQNIIRSNEMQRRLDSGYYKK